jgi:ubiquinone/menaquinone biosynthesis C-methylase UbiE
MIARAEELHSFTIRARYELGTFEALDFPAAHFDRAFSMEALYFSPDADRALAELARVLKPAPPPTS